VHQISKEVQTCIEECLSCYRVCLGTAMPHCLETGGKHVEPSTSEACKPAPKFALQPHISCC
jgi:hypothetical protein